MPFTAQELENITNAALEWHMDKGKVHSQTIEEKPLLNALRRRQKTFASGKDNITVRVKGVYTTTIQGFSGDDSVTYANPANIKVATYPWKEIHAGIKVTLTELKNDGISVSDSARGENTVRHSRREMTALANLLDDKMEDMSEGYARGFQDMYWKDGTQDAKLVPGIRSIIVDDPTAAGTVGGIDQVANSFWRNRADLTIANVSAANAGDQNLVQFFQGEFRQLRRFGGRPNLMLCGSDFLDQLERELRAKGNYTLSGWDKGGAIDASVADVDFKGLRFQYDPHMDDLSLAKRCYVLDTRDIFPMVMEGEVDKRHSPSRPEDKYVMYRAMTWTGGLICRRRNSQGVYAFT